jgi:hypothetical protein
MIVLLVVALMVDIAGDSTITKAKGAKSEAGKEITVIKDAFEWVKGPVEAAKLGFDIYDFIKEHSEDKTVVKIVEPEHNKRVKLEVGTTVDLPFQVSYEIEPRTFRWSYAWFNQYMPYLDVTLDGRPLLPRQFVVLGDKEQELELPKDPVTLPAILMSRWECHQETSTLKFTAGIIASGWAIQYDGSKGPWDGTLEHLPSGATAERSKWDDGEPQTSRVDFESEPVFYVESFEVTKKPKGFVFHHVTSVEHYQLVINKQKFKVEHLSDTLPGCR